MTDAEHADVLARMVQVGMPEDEQAAIERAIELLDREAEPEYRMVPPQAPGWMQR